MKKLLTLFVAVCMSLTMFAQTSSIHVAEAGTLKTLLGGNESTIEHLILSGKLNGTDIKLIREMIKEANLSSLDIEEAQIVAGGEAYNSIKDIDYFTENDVVGKYMFYSLVGLHKITLPKGVKVVENISLNSCVNLSSVVLPKGLTSIGEYAFTNNKGLKTIDIPETVTEIKIGAFAQCGIQSITLPKNLKSIEKHLFYWSQSLKAITIPEGITSIGIEAFKMCWALEEVNLPSSLQTIGTEAFFGCGKVKEILLPEGLTTIESGAFNSWGELVEIRIPNSVTTIGKSAFSGTSSLQSANLPEGLTRIEAQLFQHSGLPKITIPASVTSIGDDAFWSSTHPLEEIHVNNPIPPQCERATFISSCYNSAKLYVPKGSLEAYRLAPIWQHFKNIIEEEISSITPQSPDEETTVIGRQGEITINAQQPAQVAIYTLTGAQVLTTRIDGGENTIALQSGLYIVKVGTKAHKVIVK